MIILSFMRKKIKNIKKFHQNLPKLGMQLILHQYTTHNSYIFVIQIILPYYFVVESCLEESSRAESLNRLKQTVAHWTRVLSFYIIPSIPWPERRPRRPPPVAGPRGPWAFRRFVVFQSN